MFEDGFVCFYYTPRRNLFIFHKQRKMSKTSKNIFKLNMHIKALFKHDFTDYLAFKKITISYLINE